MIIEIAKYQFFHGPFQVQGYIGGLIYFDDLKMGLLAVSMDYPSNEAKYSRCSNIGLT